MGKTLLDRISLIPFYLLLFIGFWCFLYFVYGHLLYICGQYSFMAFDRTLMGFVLSTPNAWLKIIGRTMLLFMHYPLLGTGLLALLFAIVSCLAEYILRIPAFLRTVAIFPFAGYAAYIAGKGFGIYYKSDMSPVGYIPLAILCAAIALALAVRLFSGKRMGSLVSNGCTPRAWGLNVLAMAAVLASLGIYARITDYQALDMAFMQHKAQMGDWQAMNDYAAKAKHLTRPLAAFRAIALTQLDRVETDAFLIDYNYEHLDITSNDGEKDYGINLYVADGNFYAGLPLQSYHSAMNQMVLDGTSVIRLKQLALSALVQGDSYLAWKYLHILRKVPFEMDFVKKYSPMVNRPEMIDADPVLARVKDCMPREDSFEMLYLKPMFLGYNYRLSGGRSMRSLYNSLGICLYIKDLEAFMSKVGAIINSGQSLPPVYQEAIMCYYVNDISKVRTLNLSPATYSKMGDFVAAYVKGKDKPQEELARELYDEFHGTYEYYYYFMNPAKEYDHKSGKSDSDGVN